MDGEWRRIHFSTCSCVFLSFYKDITVFKMLLCVVGFSVRESFCTVFFVLFSEA